MFRLDFTRDSAGVSPTPPDKKYLICIQSILTAQRPASFDSWDDVIGLLKKLKSIGHEKTISGIRTYELVDGGGVLELQRGERQQLVEFVKGGSWVPDFLEDVRNTFKWLEGLVDEPEVPDDASPRKSDQLSQRRGART